MKQFARLMVLLVAVVITGINVPHASLAAPALPTRPFRTTGGTAQPQSTNAIYLPLVIGGGSSSSSPSPTPAPHPRRLATPSGPSPFFLPFDINNSVYNTESPHMAVDPSGGVHALYATFIAYSTNAGLPVIYSYCPSDCGKADNFHAVLLGGTSDNDNIYDAMLALDPAGHPRLLLFMFQQPGLRHLRRELRQRGELAHDRTLGAGRVRR